MLDSVIVEAALDMLRPGLDADGFELRSAPDQQLTDGGDVRVVLSARPGACLDCLVPDQLMVRMIEDAISKQGGHAGVVELARKGFGTPVGH